MLKHLNTLINNGQPLWAILSLNETAGQENPIAQALKHKARLMLERQQHGVARELTGRVLAGETLRAFTQEEQAALRAEKSRQAPKLKAFYPRPTLRTRPGHSLQVRARSSRAFRFALASNSL